MINATVRDSSSLIIDISIIGESEGAPILLVESRANLLQRLVRDRADRRKARLEVLDPATGRKATIRLCGLTVPARKLGLMLIRPGHPLWGHAAGEGDCTRKLAAREVRTLDN